MEQNLLTEIAWSELLWAEPFITIPACVFPFLEFSWFFKFFKQLNSSVNEHKSAIYRTKRGGESMWKWVAEAMKKKIIITIQIENQCKDVFFSFFSCLNLGYLSLFSFFMPVVWVSVIKHAKEKLILAFVSYDSAFHFPADVLHSKKGLLGLLHSAHRTLLTCNCTETSGQLDLKAFWACVWVSFSSRVVLLSSAFQGPLLLWCEEQRTFMSSCFYLIFFFSFCCN